jgi:hypothetical protein
LLLTILRLADPGLFAGGEEFSGISPRTAICHRIVEGWTVDNRMTNNTLNFCKKNIFIANFSKEIIQDFLSPPAEHFSSNKLAAENVPEFE